jgi:hypothetical protein
MAKRLSIDDLWNSVPSSGRTFDSAQLHEVPNSARRYLQHAIANGIPLASAVRLHMHGEIKFKGWSPFEAEEVIHWGRSLIWSAAVKMRGLTIRGGDAFADGQGVMRWKLFDLIPLVNASDPDITRSAAGRMNIESIWLPSALVNLATWTERGPSHPRAHFSAHGETADVDYAISDNGRLESVNMPRWGNPGGLKFDYYKCGGTVEEEATFGGYTIPVRMRVGWHFGTERFETEGEFFRVVIDDAIYR